MGLPTRISFRDCSVADTLPVSPYPTHGSTLLPASGSPSSPTLTRCYKQLSVDSQTQDQPVFQSDDSATHKELGCAPVLPTMVPRSQCPHPTWLFLPLPSCKIFWWASPTPRPSQLLSIPWRTKSKSVSQLARPRGSLCASVAPSNHLPRIWQTTALHLALKHQMANLPNV